MRVGLFVPCYVDQLHPGVAEATLRLLEGLGCEVGVPLDQTCCGQPMANAGYEEEGLRAARNTAPLFDEFEYVVSPSGSCVLHAREHFAGLSRTGVHERIYELCSFLSDVLEVKALDAVFPHRVALLSSCHGLRGLGLGTPSERGAPDAGCVRRVLSLVEGLELVGLERPDECCGFGGTFAVTEEAVSVRMGCDRLRDIRGSGADVVTGTDMSCLMHLEGLVHRRGESLRVLHVAEILNGARS